MKNSADIAVAVTAALVATVASAQALEKPSLAVGDRWTYRVVDVRKGEEVSTYQSMVTAISSDKIELERTTLTSANQQAIGRKVTEKADIATWTFANARLIEGKFVAIAFPIEVGKSWQYEFTMSGANGDTLQVRKAKVEALEEIRTPAGTFKAFKIVHDGNWSRMEGGRNYSGIVTETIWYAPQVKRIVKREFQDRTPGGAIWESSITELVSFGLQN